MNKKLFSCILGIVVILSFVVPNEIMAAYSWKQLSWPSGSFFDFSSDGQTIVMAPNYGYVNLSNNSGINWTTQTSLGSRYWKSVASSADGIYLVAAGDSGYIYTSSDSGINWTTQTSLGSRYWKSVASSADGTKLVAVAGSSSSGDYIYTSADSGANWTTQTSAGARKWKSVASSSDGTKLVAVAGDYYGYDYIYTSADSGANWTTQTSAGARYWFSTAMSSDGTKIIAGVNYQPKFYISNDSGANWTEYTIPTGTSVYSVSMSSDGSILSVVSYGGHPYTSNDGGNTWTDHLSVNTSGGYTNITNDGLKIYVYNGLNKYVYEDDSTPPSLTETTPVSTSTNDTTPPYAFTSNEAGTITYGGSCSSSTTNAVVGTNTITFNTLEEGTYSDCTITVTDVSENESDPLSISSFTIDITAPIISVTGSNPMQIYINSTFSDPGATCVDNIDLSCEVSTSGEVDSENLGEYVITYSVTDSAGNISTSTRIVNVVDITAPIITLLGSSSITIYKGTTYTDQGATASDDIDGDITESITTVNPVDINTVGIYTITYNVEDEAGNSATEVTRTVIVKKRPVVSGSIPTEYISTQQTGIITITSPSLTHRTLKFTMTGDDVKQLQQYLNNHNYPLTPTGPGSKNNETTYFGYLTQRSVINFQKANKLTPDGIVGSLTWGVIDKLK